MTVKYDRLFAKLKENHLTQKVFKTNANISSGTMQKLINNDSITTNTICKICDYFRCMPDDIMEFIPEPDYPEELKAKQQAKAKLEQQIAELQKQLKEI